MKKLFSFFTLFVFTLIAFFWNTMMSFAMQKDMNIEMKMDEWAMSGCCDDDSDEGSQECSHECCVSQADFLPKFVGNQWSRETNKKIKIYLWVGIDIFSLPFHIFENIKLVKITSPPYWGRDIKNYTYSDLTKIIKSNT